MRQLVPGDLCWVRGEPGVGKTQLAEAAAEALQRAFVRHVVDSRTESRDLLYTFDAVMRLAEAQLCSVEKLSAAESREQLAIQRFILPGPLWWAFNWEYARDHCLENKVPSANLVLAEAENELRAEAGNGWVVLIDEIDKAESDVPNGLLEALGSGSFSPLGCDKRVEMSQPAPLIMITTNEERTLPDAFVRRCVVLHIQLPDLEDGKHQEFTELLMKRGCSHFEGKTDTKVLKKGRRF